MPEYPLPGQDTGLPRAGKPIRRIPLFCLLLSCLLPASLHAEPYALFREYEPREQIFCGRLAGDDVPEAQNAYRVAYDARFRPSLVVRMTNNREAERWESVYDKGGVWRRTDHRRNGILLDYAEYGSHGRIIRFTRQNINEMEEYVYNPGGKLLLIRGYRGGVLERVHEVRYHPSGLLFMHLIRNNGNAVIGRALIESDPDGRPFKESTFLWGRLVKITEYRYCVHGHMIARSERVPLAHENALDPLYEPYRGDIGQ